MTIEFRCTSCDKLLRTPPGTEGKKAKCPQCGMVLTIPEQSAAPAVGEAVARDPFRAPPPEAAPLPPVSDSLNPFQSPHAGGGSGETVDRGFAPARVEFGEILGRTWAIYKKNLGMVVGGGLLAFLLMAVTGWIVGMVFGLAAESVDSAPLAILMVAMQQVAAQGVNAFFWAGLIVFSLKIARGEDAGLGDLFSGGPFFVPAAVLQIVITILTVLGFLLLIVPGIIVALTYAQSMYMLVDQRADIMTSMKMSSLAMKGNRLTMLALLIAVSLLGLLLVVVTCGIGILFFYPFYMLMLSVFYLGVTGQRTVLDGIPAPAAERPFGTPGTQPTM